jgi:iron complex transport system permease protein
VSSAQALPTDEILAPARSTRTPKRSRSSLVGRRGYPFLVAGLILALLVSALVGVSVGSVPVPLRTSWGVVADHLAFWRHAVPADRMDDAIIWTFRTPRALLAIVVGAGLAIAGTALQALVRNALADPYVLGVAQGASFGAVLVIAIGTAAAGRALMSVSAFAGAVVCLVACLVLGRRRGRVVPTRLVLAGVAIGYLFTAATGYVELRITEGESLAGVLFWLLGTVSTASWGDLGIPTVVVVACTAWLLLQARGLNALLAGEESAVALGVDVARFRAQLLVVSSLLTGAVVAVAGGVAFVGLVIPHVARMLVGVDHRRMLPVALLVGGIFLNVVDIVARTAAAPLELPLSIITAAVGAPFFLWLMRSTDTGGGAS